MPQKNQYSKVVGTSSRMTSMRGVVFDRLGVLEEVHEMAKQYSGEEKFFLTGFSAGAHVAWSCSSPIPRN
ncbi:MAG: hypothetical protein JWO80_3418 [Bryobacterales bacterium]|nr:hypothetical protein [Bryobacterales bacterium]